MAITLGLLEDDDLTRISLKAALETAGMEVVISAKQAGSMVSSLKTTAPDALILDLHLGVGPTGFDVAQAAREIYPEIGIVFLTSFDDPRLLSPSLPKPPVGSQYVTKKSISDIDQLEQLVNLAIAKSESKSPAELAALTDSQIEMLRLLAAGFSNAEIAKQSYLTLKSVEKTISKISRTLGIEHEPANNQRVLLAQHYFRATGSRGS